MKQAILGLALVLFSPFAFSTEVTLKDQLLKDMMNFCASSNIGEAAQSECVPAVIDFASRFEPATQASNTAYAAKFIQSGCEAIKTGRTMWFWSISLDHTIERCYRRAFKISQDPLLRKLYNQSHFGYGNLNDFRRGIQLILEGKPS